MGMSETINKLDYFQKKKDDLDKLISNLEKEYSQISVMRIITFLVGMALLIIGISDDKMATGITGGLFLVAFFCLVKKHSDVVRKTEVAKSKLNVVERYIKRFDDQWREFKETGKEYIDKKDTVSMDIDLLGDNSLYQMINVCHTEYGKIYLVDDMKLKFDSINENFCKRPAVEELISSLEFDVDFESAGIRFESKNKKFDTKKLCSFCKDENIGNIPKWANVCRILLPVIEIVLIILWIIGVWGYGIPLIGFLIMLSFSWLTTTVTAKAIEPFYGMNNIFDDYISMLEEIDKQQFESEYLSEIKNIIGSDKGALKALKKLNVISQAYNLSFNPLIHQVLSGLILWDYQLAYAISVWKKKYGMVIDTSFESIGKIEELMSFAVLGIVRDTGWGEINTDNVDKIALEAEEIYHPLIAPDKVVSNSASLLGGITIVTGSNMSGKTTFLRTLAINLALSYMGAPICGKKLVSNYMKIFTSMRVMDDVAGGISTFYAEILRIKDMAEYRKNNESMLCLIDEIFKGTNSADRIVGAKEAITRLAGDKCITIVSTHDFELCEIEDYKGNRATNYHFEEYYDNNELKFDYKIKDGRCVTTNALAILKMAGFDVPEQNC